jgi:prepilin signal peptidase PulO-like enzyme (type II secretory pathway)
VIIFEKNTGKGRFSTRLILISVSFCELYKSYISYSMLDIAETLVLLSSSCIFGSMKVIDFEQAEEHIAYKKYTC